MVRINNNYLKLTSNFLFATVKQKVTAFAVDHPESRLISLGIGDVTRPLAPAVIKALHQAVDEMGRAETFRGYGTEQGYEFLRRAILQHDYETRGIALDLDEIFIGDGAKTDVACIQEIFDRELTVAIADPVYPVYMDSNVMAGRTGEYDARHHRYPGMIYLACTEKNGFKAQPPECRVDLIYLCNPSNPTGTALTRSELKLWVDYAKDNRSVILYDSAYEAYITEAEIPHSIYEVEGAKDVAIEFRSFSKTAGFTGTRCSYVIVPKNIHGYNARSEDVSLNHLWNRRQSTCFNGTPYIVQRAAEAVYSPEGRKQCQADVAYYLDNARLIRNGLIKTGYIVYGAVNSPYAWVKNPLGINSWDLFELLLEQAQVITTPGAGFGPHGEGYLRLTAFGTREDTLEAVKRIQNLNLINKA